MERNMPHIPNDVAVEILSRLPARSLIQFRWTCKYWFDLITKDDYFIKMHLHRSTTTVLTISNKQFIDGFKLFHHSLDYKDTTRLGVSSEVCISFLRDCRPKCHRKVLSSCNGLILLCEGRDERLYIWNPCTKEYIILPHPSSAVELSRMHRHNYHYGFGYHHTTDDYKVIRKTYYDIAPNINQLYSDVQVYTLGTKSWRKVDRPDPYSLWNDQQEGVFLNGVIYWMDFNNENVISFDVGKEKFRDVLKTPYVNDPYVCWYDMRMRVFEGSLCIIVKSKDQEMWVMKDSAMKNNEPLWTKLSTIPNPSNCLSPFIVPLRFTRNGEILLVTKMIDLSLYDPKNNDIKTLCKICDYPSRHFIDVHTESLVSLNSGIYVGN